MTQRPTRSQTAKPAALSLMTEDGRRLWLEEGRYTIGRHDECDLIIPHPGVSLHHATIECAGDEAWIIDEHSKNGTYLNERQIEPGQRQPLARGDVLRISRSSINALRVFSPEAGDHPPPPSQEGTDLLRVVAPLNAYLTASESLVEYLHALRRLVRADRAIIIVPGQDENVLTVLAASPDGRGSKQPEDYSISLSAVRRALSSGKTVRKANLSTLEPKGSAGRFELQSLVCVPLVLRELSRQDAGENQTVGQSERTVGVLYVDSKDSDHSFYGGQLDILEITADHAALAIDRAKTHQNIVAREREEVRLRRELEVAATIQEKLLPTEFHLCDFAEICARNVPADSVSGDFYELASINENRLYLAVGDVCGHGVGAAVLMATSQAYLASMARLPHISPVAVVAEVNRLIAARCPPERFVTMCYGELHRSGLFSYVLAGHSAPIVLRRHGAVEELSGAGAILGANMDWPETEPMFTEEWTQLGEGDVIIMVTDGVIDACGGMACWIDVLIRPIAPMLADDEPCQGIVDTMFDRIERESIGPLQDDATILVARFHGAVQKQS